ncbi:MAG: hypothetical protein RSD43_03090 [Anaerovoracaceae bacterium]
MKKILTGNSLKIFAVVSMLIDHLGAIALKNGFVLNAPYSMFSVTQFAVLFFRSLAFVVCNIASFLF